MLRHRLVDLNILVSRATVFTVVSMIIVGVFVAAEWGITKVFEHSFGLSHDKSGLAAQVLTLVIVLVLGTSARSIHRFVEERLTRALFRKRLQGLTAIERVAREADAATDASDVMEIGVQTVRHALNPSASHFICIAATATNAALSWKPSIFHRSTVSMTPRRCAYDAGRTLSRWTTIPTSGCTCFSCR